MAATASAMSCFRGLRVVRSMHVSCRRFYADKEQPGNQKIWNIRYAAEGKFVDSIEGAKTLPQPKLEIPSDTPVRLANKVDFSWRGLKNFLKRFDNEHELYTQRYIDDRHKIMGNDLAAAHFVLYRGGGVRFVGQTMWHRRDDEDEYVLPNKYVPNVTVEAIDLEGVRILHEGIVNIENLEDLRWLSLRGCSEVDDWFCDRLAHFKNSLEYLDISGCSNVSEKGVATFHRFQRLKTLKLENLKKFKYQKLVCLLLEDALPNCDIIDGGVNDDGDGKTLPLATSSDSPFSLTS